MEPTAWLPAAGIVGLFTATATVFVQLLRQNSQLSKERDSLLALRDEEIRDLKLGELRCNRRVDLLIAACRSGGIAVPSEVWQ